MRLKGIITTLLSGILMVLVVSSCICDRIKNEEVKQDPNYHVHFELDNMVFDEGYRLRLLDDSRRYQFQVCEFYRPNSNPRPILNIWYYFINPVDFFLNMNIDSTLFLGDKHQYVVRKGLRLPETHEYALNGSIMRKYDVESCTFSFELPDPKDSLIAYSFLFEMELNDGIETKHLRNGKITFYNNCTETETHAFIHYIGK